jgi:hypothetical protein
MWSLSTIAREYPASDLTSAGCVVAVGNAASRKASDDTAWEGWN